MERRDFLVGLGVLGAFGTRMANAVVKDKLPPEGVQLIYRLSFGDSEIGTQKVTIRSHDKEDHVIVEHEIDLEVRILFVVAYSLTHRSTEIWHGFDLKSVNSDTNENGQRHIVEGEASQQGFKLRNENGLLIVSGNVVTLDSFWLASTMSAPKIINTRNGDIATPEIKSLGKELWHLKAKFPHGSVEATMRFDGDFLKHAEVDSDGHTVKIERISTTLS